MEITSNIPELVPDFTDLCKLFELQEKDIIIKHTLKEEKGQLFNEVKISNGHESSYCETSELPEAKMALERKKFIKRHAKLCLYNALADFFKTTLPWGSLTGIRPTSLAYDLLSQGIKPHLLKETLQKTFGVSEEKAALVSKIVANQNCIIRNDHLIDFYVNIPICPTRCNYCSFISAEYDKVKPIIPAYIDTLLKEIRAMKKLILDKALVVRTIYVGGGTPTVLTAEELELVLSELSYPVNEFTVECGRPDTITREKLEVLKRNNVTRISINPQTFCQATLKRIGRKHTVKDVLEAYKLAMEFGFNVNMDLIAGLEGERYATFKKSVETALELYPENLTIHTLSIKNGSVLAEANVNMKSEDITKMLSYSYKRLTQEGYKPYYLYRQKNQLSGLENVGYYRDNKICIFNVDSMEETCSIVAVGANAISKRVFNYEGKIERSANVKFIQDYIERIDEMIMRKNELFK